MRSRPKRGRAKRRRLFGGRGSLRARSCSARACCRSRPSRRPARPVRLAEPGGPKSRRAPTHRCARALKSDKSLDPAGVAGFFVSERAFTQGTHRCARGQALAKFANREGLLPLTHTALRAAIALGLALALGACSETIGGISPSGHVAETEADAAAQASNAG